MSHSSTLYIGLDVHKESIAVAYVAQAHDAEVIYLGPLGTRQADIDQLVRKRHSNANHLLFVYEAGPCGDWLSRDLTKPGHRCWGVAPARIPQQAGDRVNTDRRDAGPLARLMRSGELTPVDVPAVEDEASRTLRRAREEAIGDLRAAKGRRHAFLLRQDIRSTGRASWGPAHVRGLSEVVWATPAQHLVFQAYVRAGTAYTERLQRLEQALAEQVNTWRLQPVGEALQAVRGVQYTAAVPIVAALGGLIRFAPPRPLLTYPGLLPPNTPVASDAGRARSPQPVTRMPDAPWWEAPGPTGIPPTCVATGHSGWSGSPSRSKASVGRRRCGCTNACAAYEPAANTPARWSSPWPGNWWAFCGRLPNRCW
jgi:transposase